MKKNSFSLSLKNITILAGVCVILLSVSIYASSQNKKSYRSVNNSTTVGYENTTASFNANKIEEHGDCKIVTANTCGKDVFIPTKTSPERTAFKDNHPLCITLADCANTCVLKEFMEGVYAGTTTHSKVRNAVAFSNHLHPGILTGSTMTNPTLGHPTPIYPFFANDNFIVGYGLDFAIALATGYDGRSKIVSNESIIATGINDISSFNSYEFELYGITPETENTNRGCFDDGSYRVNSNIHSRQVLTYQHIGFIEGESGFSGNFITTRFGGTIGVNFGLVFLGGGVSIHSAYNRFFGCRSELLPNPDKYCVERLVPQDGTSVEKPSAIYLKEFSNNASFSYAGCSGTGDACLAQRNSICTSLTGVAGGKIFRTFSTGDMVPSGLFNMISPSGTTNNTGFIYKNTTGTTSYGTQIFGFNRYSNSTYFPFVTVGDANGTHSFAIGSYMDNNYYYYNDKEERLFVGNGGANAAWSHRSFLGYNTAAYNDGSEYGVRIPLQDTDNMLFNAESSLSSYEVWSTGDVNEFLGTGVLTKYVCVSYTCNPCYTPTANGGCVHNNTPACNNIVDDGPTTPTTPIGGGALLGG